MKNKEQIKQILERNIGITELYRMNVTFDLDLEDDLMGLLWDKDC